MEHKLSHTIEEAINEAKELSKTSGSRELSLVITKLEEALMWIQRVEV